MSNGQNSTKSFRKAIRKCIDCLNKTLLYAFQHLKINEKLIVMESEGDFSDNAFALYDYLSKNSFLDKYKIVWLVSDVKAMPKNLKNTKFIIKFPRFISVKRCFYLATCKFYFFTHCNVLSNYRNRDGRTIVNLWHGCGFKSGKGSSETDYIGDHSEADYIFVTGRLFRPGHKAVFHCNDDKILEIGYPRNDYLFMDYNERQIKFYEKFLSGYKKRILWMPTFRRSVNDVLDEEYFNSLTGLPLIDNKTKLDSFNEFLRVNDTICVFKLHHLQSELNVFTEKYSNILLIRDEDLKTNNLQLNQVVLMFDILLTDYSSIATDYLLLDRPIIFTVDDYDTYNNSRGFILEDPIQYFPGCCVKTESQLIEAVEDVINDKDSYKATREALLNEYHHYTDGNASKRIVELLNL